MTAGAAVRVDYNELHAFVAAVFRARGVPADRASAAAEALCYGDLSGHASHGVANLAGLYLPLFDQARVEPAAEPRVVTDCGAALLVDARRTLGLWYASEAMDAAAARAARYGVGVVSVRNATHFGCAGYHAARAVRHGMVGMVACNCGRQRIARPPGGRIPLFGTNPLSFAAPAGDHPPFVLDMSTTATPTGRVRAAARAGASVPEGWLADDAGRPVTDPTAFDRGEAHLLWLGEAAGGVYKGYGLGLLVEVLAALVAGAGIGPSTDALVDETQEGEGPSSPPDDDIGFLALAIAPGVLRSEDEFRRDAEGLFGTLLDCPPTAEGAPVRYPGWHEAQRAREYRRDGVPLSETLYDELGAIAAVLSLPLPAGAR